MSAQDRLYDALGEIAYAIAKADGLIDQDEISRLTKILEKHPWASNIKWSFNYEWLRDEDAETIYKKAITRCIEHGPSEDYKEFIDLMNEIAKASNGVDSSEQDMINSFSIDLIKGFQTEIDKLEE